MNYFFTDTITWCNNILSQNSTIENEFCWIWQWKREPRMGNSRLFAWKQLKETASQEEENKIYHKLFSFPYLPHWLRLNDRRVVAVTARHAKRRRDGLKYQLHPHFSLWQFSQHLISSASSPSLQSSPKSSTSKWPLSLDFLSGNCCFHSCFLVFLAPMSYIWQMRWVLSYLLIESSVLISCGICSGNWNGDGGWDPFSSSDHNGQAIMPSGLW